MADRSDVIGGQPRRGAILAAAGLMLLLAAAPCLAQGAAVFESSVLAAPRNAEGRLGLRAVRLETALRVDGSLDEAIYTRIEPVSDFIQMEPDGGQAATERTDVWVFFDRNNVYVTIRAWESRPELAVANEMRRDSGNIRMGDSVGFSLDTFLDRRNAYQFEVNPLGARTDGQSTNERQYQADWNPVWDLSVGRFEGGWTVEAAVPFKSLRYRPGTNQTWGFNARRNNKWKNEIAYLSVVPPAYGIGRGSFSASLFPTLNGIDAPSPPLNLEVKPFTVGNLVTDRVAVPGRSNELDGSFGMDAKYAVGQSMTLDLTYNTDFAQVEADEQQVNLTRFSLFFPEKREFFLENLGTFTFGAAGGAGGNQAVGNTPLLFYSRRIGLNQNREVPILAGGRLSGRLGRFSLGAINIGTEDTPEASAPSTNFSVLRLRSDVLRRSSVGVMATHRSVAQVGEGSNTAYGVDGAFQFFEAVTINTYWAKTDTTDRQGDDTSYRGQFEYAADRYGLTVDRLVIGRNFNPEVGFLRRADIAESSAQARFSPRPVAIDWVRRFVWTGSLTYLEDGQGLLDTRRTEAEFAIELENSDRFSVTATDNFERLTRLTTIAGAPIPAGRYDFAVGRIAYNFGQQRPVSGNVAVEYGEFYTGHRTSLTFSRSRVNVSPRLSFEPNLSLNWLDLPEGRTNNNLVGSRVTYTATPLMFVSALVQYNTGTSSTSANIRLRWEYQPGSELFVVFNEERDTHASGFPDLQNRAFIVKINRLFRF